MKPVKTINNQRARYDYHLSDKIVAGISLSGPEVIGIRNQRVSLKNAFINIKGGNVWLQNLQIFKLKDHPAGKQKQTAHQLLLTKAQIKKLQNGLESKYNTIVPIKIILGDLIKIEIALGLGKRRYDKRESIKARESELRIKRHLRKN